MTKNTYKVTHSLLHVSGIPILLVAEAEVPCKSNKEVSDAASVQYSVLLTHNG